MPNGRQIDVMPAIALCTEIAREASRGAARMGGAEDSGMCAPLPRGLSASQTHVGSRELVTDTRRRLPSDNGCDMRLDQRQRALHVYALDLKHTKKLHGRKRRKARRPHRGGRTGEQLRGASKGTGEGRSLAR